MSYSKELFFRKMNWRNVKIVLMALAAAVLVSTTPVLAQSESVKKAVQNVEESVNTLAVSKDEGTAGDLGLRIEAFKKVTALSTVEVKDAKVKLILTDDDSEHIKAWKESVILKLNGLLDYVDDRQKAVSSGAVKDIQTIKDMAQSFKEWRETEYLPVLEEVDGYLAIRKGLEIIKTAEARAGKINKDILKIQKSNPRLAAILKTQIAKAQKKIDEANKFNDEAATAFDNANVQPIVKKKPLSEASTTIEIGFATTTIELSLTTKKATSSDIADDKEEDGKDLGVSIKDLVKTSFQKIKDAYQIFIEMSNSVREL